MVVLHGVCHRMAIKKPTKNPDGVVREAMPDMPTADLNKVGNMPPCNAKEGLATNVMEPLLGSHPLE